MSQKMHKWQQESKEDVSLFAQQKTELSDSSSPNPSAILSGALKFYCRIYDCRFQKKAEMIEMDVFFT